MARARPWRGGSTTHAAVEVEIEALPASPCQGADRAHARRERAPREPPIGEHRASAIVHRGAAATRASPPQPTSFAYRKGAPQRPPQSPELRHGLG
jgi:hypothetical protein